MFLSKFKKIVNRAIFVSLLICLFGSAAAVAETKISKSKVFIHENSSGGKARDIVRLPKPPKLASGSCALFVSADVVYDKRRFGVAEIKTMPKKNCNAASDNCTAIVEWKLAPVGRLHYRVETKWKVQSSGC